MKRRRLSTTARVEFFLNQGGRCADCGVQIRAGQRWDLDHRVPLAQGGADEPENWQVLCRVCHGTKTRRDATDTAKARRREAAHLGARKPRTPIRGWKRFDGTPVARSSPSSGQAGSSSSGPFDAVPLAPAFGPLERRPAVQSDDTPPASPAEPDGWLPTAAVDWLRDYEGPACARTTAVHNRPIKGDGGVPFFLATPPASPAEPDEGVDHNVGRALDDLDAAFPPAATNEEVARVVKRLTSGNAGWADLCQAADLLARVARERDEARDWLRLRAHDVMDLGQQLAAAEQRAEAAMLRWQQEAHAANAAVERAEAAEKVLRDFTRLWPRPFPAAGEDMARQQELIDRVRAHLAKHGDGRE